MKVGFVGTGIMGTPMALNILKRGHQVVAYNRTPEKTAPLRDAGATVATSLLENQTSVDPFDHSVGGAEQI